MKSVGEQLFPKIQVNNETGCWEWTASKVKGYGRVGRDGKLHLAHRLMYEWLRGPIPEGLQIDHLCRVPACVNPAHLEPVTHAENMRRAGLVVDRCRKAGHLYDEVNTRIGSNGKRFCRQCDRDRYHRLGRNRYRNGAAA